MPMTPARLAPIKNIIRHHLMPLIKSLWLTIKPLIAVMAIIMTIIGETIPAATAAFPKINDPTIDKELPILLDVLNRFLSIFQKSRSLKIASIIVEKGTPFL